MAKDLPYFKFFVSEWTDGDITLEDINVQGVFINVCAYYWSKECDLDKDLLYKKFKGYEKELNTLIYESIIKYTSDKVTISFLDEQRGERSAKSLINSKNGKKGGRPKKPTESENKPNALKSLSETKGIKKRREEKREDKKESFEIFWSKYPNKVAKKKAEGIFLNLSDESIKTILETIDTFAKHKPFEAYTHPNPTTYLNQERWNDVIEEPVDTGGEVRNFYTLEQRERYARGE